MPVPQARIYEKGKRGKGLAEMIRSMKRRYNEAAGEFERAKWRGMLKSCRGATAAEYAILVALIAGVIIFVVSSLGQILSGLFNAALQGW